MNEELGLVKYFAEQKKAGRIRHLGFSTHAVTPTIEKFLDTYGEYMEFCQIQMNYLDWTLQDAKGKYEMLKKRGIPVIVMEPIRGGKLAVLPEEVMAELQAEGGAESTAAAYALRFVEGLDQVRVILSGMSNMQQMAENIQTMESPALLSDKQTEILFRAADTMKNSVPCTACRYCCEGCPKQLNIPVLLANYNDFLLSPSVNIQMFIDSLPEDKKPAACIGCGKCAKICPQNIDVPMALKTFASQLGSRPSWAQICAAREAAGMRLA